VTRGKAVGVKLVGAYLHVVTSHGDESETEELLREWMRKRALEQFSRRVEAWRRWCQRQQLPVPRMSLRAMSKRWGSAQRNGKIMLNPDLVRVPSVCIDYVVAHEICHLKHPHHGPAFYRQLDALLPGWRNAKGRLEHAEL
jgi:predicted metal-dependent hydrolase